MRKVAVLAQNKEIKTYLKKWLKKTNPYFVVEKVLSKIPEKLNQNP